MPDVKARLKLRQGSSSTWAALNPVLLIGELGFETDTKRLRIGDGVTAFSALPAFETRLPAWGDISGRPAAFPPAAHTHLASGISDSSVIGQDLLKAPDPAAIWTLLYLGALAGKEKVSVPGDINASGTPNATTFLRGDGAWSRTFGFGQTLQNVTGSRAANTNYQNTTGVPIMVIVQSIGANGSRVLRVGNAIGAWEDHAFFNASAGFPAVSLVSVVPTGWYYRYEGVNVYTWGELR